MFVMGFWGISYYAYVGVATGYGYYHSGLYVLIEIFFSLGMATGSGLKGLGSRLSVVCFRV